MTTYNQRAEFSGSVRLTLRWPDFKALASSKILSIQYLVNVDSYTLFAVDRTIVYTCLLVFTADSPGFPWDPDYSQAQNDIDVADFETNYKPYANAPIDDTEFDPRLIRRFGNLTSASGSEVVVSARPYTEPAAEAQRSIVSTSVQDKAGGSGTVAVRLTYLNSAYTLRTEDFALNGTTPVNSIGTDIRFVERFQKIQGADAVGAIKLMTGTGGGGTEIAGIGTGADDAFLCHHYVPAGMRAWVLGWGATIDGNSNFKLKGQQIFSGNRVDQNLDLENLFIGGTGTPNRSEFYRTFPRSLPIGEKCYVRVTVVPSASGIVERAYLDLWEDKA